jgi:hypothetical protein
MGWGGGLGVALVGALDNPFGKAGAAGGAADAAAGKTVPGDVDFTTEGLCALKS